MTKTQINLILQYVESKITKADKEGLLTLSFSNEKDQDATSFFCHTRYGYLSMIEVKQAHQKKGIARRVITLVSEAANKYGISLYTFPTTESYGVMSLILEDNEWEPEKSDSYNFYF